MNDLPRPAGRKNSDDIHSVPVDLYNHLLHHRFARITADKESPQPGRTVGRPTSPSPAQRSEQAAGTLYTLYLMLVYRRLDRAQNVSDSGVSSYQEHIRHLIVHNLHTLPLRYCTVRYKSPSFPLLLVGIIPKLLPLSWTSS